MHLSSQKLLTAFVLIALGQCLTSVAEGQPAVQGVIVDSAGAPVEGVEVSVWGLGQKDPLFTKRTDKKGTYTIADPIKEPFDLLFTHSKYDPVVVPALTPSRHQCISKILYVRGEKRSLSGVHDGLLSAERLVVLLGSVPRNQRSAMLEQFERRGISISEIGRTPPTVETLPEDLSTFFREREQILAQTVKVVSQN